MEWILEKEAFWTFLEHKSEENGKVLIFLAGNSTWRRQEQFDDGVKSKNGDGPVKTWRRQNMVVKSKSGDGLEKTLHMTASDLDVGNLIIFLAADWRRQNFLLDAVTLGNLYIVFVIFILKGGEF